MLALFTAATTLARLALLILARGFLTESLVGRKSLIYKNVFYLIFSVKTFKATLKECILVNFQ